MTNKEKLIQKQKIAFITLNIISEYNKSEDELVQYLIKNVGDIRTFNSVMRVIRKEKNKDVEKSLLAYKQVWRLQGEA